MSKKVKPAGLAREIVIYTAFGILPFLGAVVVAFVFSLTYGLYTLVIVAALLLYATVRMGLFVGLEGWEWLAAFGLFVAGYAGSIAYMLYMARRYHRHPPEAYEDSEPDYIPRGESVILDWSQPHGHGGAD